MLEINDFKNSFCIFVREWGLLGDKVDTFRKHSICRLMKAYVALDVIRRATSMISLQ